jgi:hypothetical protein
LTASSSAPSRTVGGAAAAQNPPFTLVRAALAGQFLLSHVRGIVSLVRSVLDDPTKSDLVQKASCVPRCATLRLRISWMRVHAQGRAASAGGQQNLRRLGQQRGVQQLRCCAARYAGLTAPDARAKDLDSLFEAYAARFDRATSAPCCGRRLAAGHLSRRAAAFTALFADVLATITINYPYDIAQFLVRCARFTSPRAARGPHVPVCAETHPTFLPVRAGEAACACAASALARVTGRCQRIPLAAPPRAGALARHCARPLARAGGGRDERHGHAERACAHHHPVRARAAACARRTRPRAATCRWFHRDLTSRYKIEFGGPLRFAARRARPR